MEIKDTLSLHTLFSRLMEAQYTLYLKLELKDKN